MSVQCSEWSLTKTVAQHQSSTYSVPPPTVCMDKRPYLLAFQTSLPSIIKNKTE